MRLNWLQLHSLFFLPYHICIHYLIHLFLPTEFSLRNILAFYAMEFLPIPIEQLYPYMSSTNSSVSYTAAPPPAQVPELTFLLLSALLLPFYLLPSFLTPPSFPTLSILSLRSSANQLLPLTVQLLPHHFQLDPVNPRNLRLNHHELNRDQGYFLSLQSARG